jgi:replicative DNA helicase
VPQWDCEHQLVGALLHLPADQAATILKLVPHSAISQRLNRWTYEVIDGMVADGRDPDPVLVLATARHQPPADTRPGRPVSARRHHELAVHLADLYTRTVTPAAARQYAREVLDDAFRRAVAAHGERLHELAEGAAARDELAHCLTAMRAELTDLWRRSQAARRSRPAS